MAASFQRGYPCRGHQRMPGRRTIPRGVEIHFVRHSSVDFDVAVCQGCNDVQVGTNALAVCGYVWIDDIAADARMSHGAAPRIEEMFVHVYTLTAKLSYALGYPLVGDEAKVLLDPRNPILGLKLTLNDFEERQERVRLVNSLQPSPLAQKSKRLSQFVALGDGDLILA